MKSSTKWDPDRIGGYHYTRVTGEEVFISWAPLPKRGWRIQVAIDGDGPTTYTTPNEPHAWAAGYETEDRADYWRLNDTEARLAR